MITFLVIWNAVLTLQLYKVTSGRSWKYPWVKFDKDGMWFYYGNYWGSTGRRIIPWSRRNLNTVHTAVIPWSGYDSGDEWTDSRK